MRLSRSGIQQRSLPGFLSDASASLKKPGGRKSGDETEKPIHKRREREQNKLQ
jgi:hypothetical protein